MDWVAMMGRGERYWYHENCSLKTSLSELEEIPEVHRDLEKRNSSYNFEFFLPWSCVALKNIWTFVVTRKSHCAVGHLVVRANDHRHLKSISIKWGRPHGEDLDCSHTVSTRKPAFVKHTRLTSCHRFSEAISGCAGRCDGIHCMEVEFFN